MRLQDSARRARARGRLRRVRRVSAGRAGPGRRAARVAARRAGHARPRGVAPHRRLADDPLAMHAVRLRPDEHIVVDGTLSSPAWQRAPVYDSFVENEPHRGAKPRYATKVQVLFDESAIYVGVTALDDHPEQIAAPLVRHDNVIRTQDFVVRLPRRDRQAPVGAVLPRERLGQHRRRHAHGQPTTTRTSRPTSTSTPPPRATSTATPRCSASRSRRCASRPIDARHVAHHGRPPHAARPGLHVDVGARAHRRAVVHLGDAAAARASSCRSSKSFLTVRPSITARRTSDTEPGEPTHMAGGVQGSLDVKWRASPELVIDGTLKPDFSQVALDVPQLSGNTDFALYLPEKRPFFFESSDLLHSPTEALYTRSFTAPRWGVRCHLARRVAGRHRVRHRRQGRRRDAAALRLRHQHRAAARLALAVGARARRPRRGRAVPAGRHRVGAALRGRPRRQHGGRARRRVAGERRVARARPVAALADHGAAVHRRRSAAT